MLSIVLVLLLLFIPSSTSTSISDIQVGTFHPYTQSAGDTWISAWADDGEIYSVADDTRGFNLKGPRRNLMVNRLSGDDPSNLKAVTVNSMDEYGKATAPMSALGYGSAAAKDGRAWKANGITCIDGVLYVFVSKHDYPWRNKSLTDNRQTASDSSIIKSTDHGRTWTRSSEENYLKPMFPGRRFGAPFFITYGRNGKSEANRSDTFVYAISTNGFWNNGDKLYLGRVRRKLLPRLSGSDWEFYREGDGSSDKAWTKDITQARPIVVDLGHLSMSAIQYIKPLGQYLLCEWHYPPNTFGGGTTWNFLVAKAPWGPWKALPEKSFQDGYYNPAIANKFSSSDGRRQFAFAAGDFKRIGALYKLHSVEIDLQP